MVDAAIAVLSLLLGYGLSQLQMRGERSRLLRNLRGVLGKELRDNYKAICGLSAEAQNGTFHGLVVASDMRRFLMRRVVDAYLDRLSDLPSAEFEGVYNAHVLTDQTRESAAEIQSLIESLDIRHPDWSRPCHEVVPQEALELVNEVRLRLLNNAEAARRTLHAALSTISQPVPTPEEIRELRAAMPRRR